MRHPKCLLLFMAPLLVSLVGAQPMVWTETNGSADWAARGAAGTVMFNGRLWTMGGNSSPSPTPLNDVWSSRDGVNWTPMTPAAGWGPRASHACLVFANKIWVMGGWTLWGHYNDVWSSEDGVNWTLATAHAGWSPREHPVAMVFDGKMWIMGGFDSGRRNDVWYSSDGVNWTQATASAAWSPRVWFAGAVFDGRMWVLGGSDPSQWMNDAWYSTDGANWSLATAAADWSARTNPISVAWDNQLWVMGGRSAGGYLNDVWHSSDGVAWEQSISSPVWEPRDVLSSVRSGSRVWVLGGQYGGSNFYNDVWYSGPMPAAIEFDPRSLNMKTGGVWVTCYIELSGGNSVQDIDTSTVAISWINDQQLPSPLYRDGPTAIGDHDADGTPDLMVKFSRAALVDILKGLGVKGGNRVALMVKGALDGSLSFEDQDLIKIVDDQSEEGTQTSARTARPGRAALWSVAPNPITTATTLAYSLVRRGRARISVYDATGRPVNVLEDSPRSVGDHVLRWDGTDFSGRKLSNGVYACRLETDDQTSTATLTIAR